MVFARKVGKILSKIKPLFLRVEERSSDFDIGLDDIFSGKVLEFVQAQLYFSGFEF